MIALRRYEFKCPFCGKNKVTFVSPDKLIEIQNREKNIQEILDERIYDASYREIFVSKICSKCQITTFDSNPNDKPFDVDENQPTDELVERISEMYFMDRG